MYNRIQISVVNLYTVPNRYKFTTVRSLREPDCIKWTNPWTKFLKVVFRGNRILGQNHEAIKA